MKKHVLILSLTVFSLLFSQCKKEVITENGTLPVNGTFTLTANIDNGGGKTDITPSGAITWKSGDVIYIANSTGIVGSLSHSGGNNFTGDLTLANDIYYFYYLGSKDRSASLANGTTSIEITEFATQAGTLADITQNHHLMRGWATVTNNIANVTLTSMISIAYLDISGFKGETVKLYGTNIYKGMKLNLAEETVTNTNYTKINAASDEGSAITIGGTGTAGAYVAFVPTDGATLTFKGTATGDYTVPMAGSYKFTANMFYTQNGGPIAVKTRPAGSLPGRFSVGPYTKVRFSQGNLQYIGNAVPTPYWKFADNQWDYFGDGTGGATVQGAYFYNNSDQQTACRDLFGWGTSGQKTEAKCYQPWSTSTESSDYVPGGPFQLNDLTYTNKADWGYNAISNGGNTIKLWHTLTNDEWAYLIGVSASSGRTGAINGVSKPAMEMRAPSKVNGVCGLIILPDVFTTPSDMSTSFTSGYGVNWDTYNNFSSVDWSKMESAGAVFLPAAGYRDGTSVDYVGTYGLYWSSSYYYSNGAYNLRFYSDGVTPSSYRSRYLGLSVRLVKDLSGAER